MTPRNGSPSLIPLWIMLAVVFTVWIFKGI